MPDEMGVACLREDARHTVKRSGEGELAGLVCRGVHWRATYTVRLQGSIVADSDAKCEFQETIDRAQAMIKTIALAETRH